MDLLFLFFHEIVESGMRLPLLLQDCVTLLVLHLYVSGSLLVSGHVQLGGDLSEVFVRLLLKGGDHISHGL